MIKPILNISDVELQPRPAAFAATGSAAERFDARMGVIADSGIVLGVIWLIILQWFEGQNRDRAPLDPESSPGHDGHAAPDG